MDNLHTRLLHTLVSQPWAMQPERLMSLLRMAQAVDVSMPEEGIPEAAVKPRPMAGGAVAVIPIQGMIEQRQSLLGYITGGTTTGAIEAAIGQALGDARVKSIVLDVDSPGGTVYGVDELAGAIYAARGQKRITAQVNSLAASAAYYLASQANEIAITPSGEAGSIGVWQMHIDYSQALAEEGIKPTLIASSPQKVEGNPYEPLPDDARARMQAQVDRYAGMFREAVARGRGVSVATVRNQFGEGLVFGADEAKTRGLADRVATLGQTLARAGGDGGVVPIAAMEDGEELQNGSPAHTITQKRRRLDLLSV